MPAERAGSNGSVVSLGVVLCEQSVFPDFVPSRAHFGITLFSAIVKRTKPDVPRRLVCSVIAIEKTVVQLMEKITHLYPCH